MGKRIQATIDRHLIPEFDHQLREHALYALMDFDVKGNDIQYKLASHFSHLCIKESTKVLERDMGKFPEFPKNICMFKSLADVMTAPRVEGADLFDVIGSIIPNDGLKTFVKDGKTNRTIDFLLEDSEKRRVMCTLWNDYANEMSNYIEAAKYDVVAVIIQFCRLNVKRGNSY